MVKNKQQSPNTVVEINNKVQIKEGQNISYKKTKLDDS